MEDKTTGKRLISENSNVEDIYFRALFENSYEPVFFIDSTTMKFVDVNEAALLMYGYSKEEFLNLSPIDLSADKESSITNASELKEGINKIKVERRHKKKDGSEIIVEIYTTIVFLEDNLIGIGQVRDITERKKAEEALLEGQKRLEQAILGSDLGLWDLNIQTGKTFSDEHSLGIIGFLRGEISSDINWLADIVHIDDLSRVALEIQNFVMNRGEIFQCEYRVRTKTGEWKWLLDRGRIVEWDKHGNPLRMMGTHMDITERKKMEEALRESKEKYQGIFDESVAAIYVFDEKKKFTDSNQAGLDLLGYTRPELMSKSIPDVDADPVVVLPAHEQLLSGNRLVNYEHRLKRKNGEIITVLNNSRSFKDATGKVIGILSTLTDITEHKKTEEQKIELERQLLKMQKMQIEDALQKSDLLIRSINDNIANGMVYQLKRMPDGSKNFTYLSDRVKDFYGITPQEGMSNADLMYSRVHEDERMRVFQEEEKSFETMSIYSAEVRMLNNNGKVRWSYFVSRPRKEKDGSTCWDGIEFDITERKKTEERLKRSEHIHKMIAKMTTDYFFRLDVDSEGNIMMGFASEGMQNITGRSPEEVQTKDSWMKIFHPDDKEKALALLKSVLSSDQCGEIECRTFLGNGQERWVLITACPEWDMEKQQLVSIWGSVKDITDHKKWEEELRESEERFSTAFGSSSMLMAISELENGRYIDINNAFEEVLGFTSNEVIGKTSIELGILDMTTRQTVINILSEQGEVRKHDMKVKTKTGEIIDGLFFAKKININGKGCLLTAMIDITDRKKTEVKLIESENKYKTLIENINTGIFMSSLEGKFIHVNPILVEMTGYDSIDELMNLPAQCLYANISDRERMKSILLKDGFVKENEINGVKKDGTICWISISAVLLKDELGNIFGILGSVQNITERKKVEKALEDTASFVSSINDNLFNGMIYQVIAMEDGTRKFTYLSDKVRYFYGISPQEGMKDANLIYDRIHKDDISRVIQEEKKVLETMSVFQIETRIINHKGELRWSFFISRPIKADNGSIVWNGIEFDITERKKSEEDLQNYKEHLETLVEERTKELQITTEQLLQSQKMEAIGQLAGGIAHDFNNIIATISGTAELLVKKTPPDAPMHKKLERILRSSQRAKDITMKLLTFARKEKLNVKPIHPKEIVTDLIDMLKSTSSSKINVTTEYEDGIKKITVDSNQIFQAILNMTLNACDAMPDGGNLRIRISSAWIDDKTGKDRNVESGEFIVISVEDTGTGIDDDKVGKVFEPFFTTKDKGKGSGLGLSISHGIIKSHNGFIQVKSQKGKGTAFSIFLPSSDSLESTSEAEDKKRTARKEQGNILIIDDDQEFVGMIKDSLEEEGFITKTALSGKEAINYYTDRINEIDIVLLDMLLPEMNGTEIYFALKELNPTVKIILCSGYSIEGDASTLLNKGALAFVQKPFDISDVVDIISEILHKKRQSY